MTIFEKLFLLLVGALVAYNIYINEAYVSEDAFMMVTKDIYGREYRCYRYGKEWGGLLTL